MSDIILSWTEPTIYYFGRKFTVDEYCAAHGDEPAIARRREKVNGRWYAQEQRVPRALFERIRGLMRVDNGFRIEEIG